MDFGVPIGTPVRAVAAGKVLYANWSQGMGWPNPYYIAIDFDGPANGDQSAGIVVVIDHGSYASVYAHLNQTGLNPGNTVREGEIIGQTGNTGRSSGPHLHFEILPDKWDVHAKWYGRINPRYIIKPTVKENTVANTGEQAREVWAYKNERLERDDAYALLRAIRDKAVQAEKNSAEALRIVKEIANK